MKRKGFRTGIVRKLIGLSYKRIEYYDQHGIVHPDLQKARGRGSRRLYSRDNLAELNVLKKLMDRDITLYKIRKAIAEIKKRFPKMKRPLKDMEFLTNGQTIFIKNPQTGEVIDLLMPDQPVLFKRINQISDSVNSDIHNIDVASIETLSVDGKDYLIELVEEATGQGVVARCPDLYGVSVKAGNEAEALTKMEKRLAELKEHFR